MADEVGSTIETPDEPANEMVEMAEVEVAEMAEVAVTGTGPGAGTEMTAEKTAEEEKTAVEAIGHAESGARRSGTSGEKGATISGTTGISRSRAIARARR